MKTKIIKRLNKWLFGEYSELHRDRAISKKCDQCKWDHSFDIGFTKYYVCRTCYTWKHVYKTRWFRL